MAVLPNKPDPTWLAAVKSGVKGLLSGRPETSPRRGRPTAASRGKTATAPKMRVPVDTLLIRQQIWGEGCLFPGGLELGLELVKPFAVDSRMTLCDLSAGLGGPSRKVVAEFDVYITGFEQVPEIATRGHALSIAAKVQKKLPITAFTPGLLKLKPRTYDGIYGHLMTWKVPDKRKLFGDIKQALKPDGSFHFTDFILGADETAQGQISRLLKVEPTAVPPWQLTEMTNSLKAAGFNCRVADDLTDRLMEQALETWKTYIRAAQLKTRPANELAAILDEAEIWCLRLSALRSGAIRYFRFYSQQAN